MRIKKNPNIVSIPYPYEKTDKKSFTDFFAINSISPLKWTKLKCYPAGFLLRFYFKIPGRQFKISFIQGWIHYGKGGYNANGK